MDLTWKRVKKDNPHFIGKFAESSYNFFEVDGHFCCDITSPAKHPLDKSTVLARASYELIKDKWVLIAN